MTKLLIGQVVADKIEKEICVELQKIKTPIGLAVVLVGDNPSSEIYIQKKVEFCQRVGILVEVFRFNIENVTQEKIIKEIKLLNQNNNFTGILIQLPLPAGFDKKEILHSIDPNKDVDCLCEENFGQFCGYDKKGNCPVPVTALAVLEILKFYQIPLDGMRAVVVGNSNIAGKPIAIALLERGVTVTVCHDRTKDLATYTKEADLLISAVGKKHLITGEMVKYGAIVIDVGIVREGRKVYGDIDFESVKEKSTAITPVPGGLGPVTVASLIRNVVNQAKKIK